MVLEHFCYVSFAGYFYVIFCLENVDAIESTYEPKILHVHAHLGINIFDNTGANGCILSRYREVVLLAQK